MAVFERRIKRGIALVVCVCFIATLFPEAYAQMPSLQMAVKSETPRMLNIDIPTELATVEDWYEAPSNPKPRLVVHIQDAHSNYEAQSRIRDLIEYLNKNYGFKTILVEGAASELDPNILKLFPDKERNIKLADELAKIGEVTGAEMYLVEHENSAKAFGIEKPELYRKNFDALQKVYSEDGFTTGFFEAYEKKLGQVASRSFGPRMIQALAEWRKFESGHRDFLPFVEKLAELSKKVLNLDLNVLYSQIEWPQLTRLLVLQKIEEQLKQQSRAHSTEPIDDSRKPMAEHGQGSQLSAVSSQLTLREQALHEKQAILSLLKEKGASAGLIQGLEKFDEKSANLNRIGSSEIKQIRAPRALMETLVEEGRKVGFDFKDYRVFAKYAGYLILRSEIEPNALFSEIKKLFDRLLEKLVKEAPSTAKTDSGDEAERGRLLLLHRDEMLARKLLKLELTHDEWLNVLNRQERFYPEDLNRRMLEALGQNPREFGASEKSKNQIKKLNEAFRSAFAFYSAAVNRETYFFQRTQEILNQSDRVILITGGFHAEGMKYFFRKYDINYGTLTPRITKEFTNETYRKVMMTGLVEAATNDQRPTTDANAKTPQGLPAASPEVAQRDKASSKNQKKSNAVQNDKLGIVPPTEPKGHVMEGVYRSEQRREIRFKAATAIGPGGGESTVQRSENRASIGLSAPLTLSGLSEARAGFIDRIKEFMSEREGKIAALAFGIAFATPFLVAPLLLSPSIGFIVMASSIIVPALAIGFQQAYRAFNRIYERSHRGNIQIGKLSRTPPSAFSPLMEGGNPVDAFNLVFQEVEIAENLMRRDDKSIRLVPNELVLRLIEEAKTAELVDKERAVGLIGRIGLNNIEINSDGKGKLQLTIATFRLAVQIEKEKLAIFEKSERTRLQSDAERRVKALTVQSKATADFPEDLKEVLATMTYDDWYAHAQTLKNLTAVEAVAFLSAFGFFATQTAQTEMFVAFKKLTSIVIAKVQPGQLDEMRQMLQTFFPEMFTDVKNLNGYLNPVLSAGDKNLNKQIEIFKMQALFNPGLKINIFIIGMEKIDIEKVSGNLIIHRVFNFASVAKKLNMKSANGVYRSSVSQPGLLAISVELSGLAELKTLVNGEGSFSGMQIVVNEASSENNVLASEAMVLGVKRLMIGGDSIRPTEADGIDSQGGKSKTWKITNTSLNSIKDLSQKFLAALKIMQSA